ncbi:MAG: glycoside hydrolase family 88 protein [Clostridia bacterium]|nr:glycoside hydrolase family 88 protein [Clostridia bacterium]
MAASNPAVWAEQTLLRLKQKIPGAIEKAQGLDFLPYTVENGQWKPGPMDGICWWTNGFWPALMWQMYDMTGEVAYLREARRAQDMLDRAFADFSRLHHDVGFMWRISSGFDYDLTGDQKNRERAVFAANLLAGRYNPNGFIRAWNDDKAGWAIIDCMMNLSLLYWATKQTGDPRFSLIAQRHADTVIRHFIRPDGTSEHIVVFDPVTGEAVDKPGGQGYAAGTVWSRGQAWAIYGFAISYRHTGRQEYLRTARRVADAFLARIGGDWLPDCDFVAPKDPVLKDDCAGAIAACGLMEMADALGETGEAYRSAAVSMLRALEEKHVDWSADQPALLTHCTGSYHTADHHIAMVYGDYFFVEGVSRLLGRQNLRW